MNTQTKTALITGASRGLGLALATALAQDGWQLIINARGEAALQQAHHQLERWTTVTAVTGDISQKAHRQALAVAARAAGGLDLVVNNAGILGPSPQPALLDYPLDVLEDVFRVNVIAQLGVLQAVQESLKPNGRILNISSDAAVEPYEGWGGYGASKAAFEQISAVLAAELAAQRPDLRVYWVDPGDMRTQMHQAAFPGEDISDRPLPEASVPGLLQLINGEWANGRYQAQNFPVEAAA
ncbi:MAG: SDR family oxidoreductase [Ardenticatenaceae bacterium]|nr:SDR family oxidoreductase [Ardenticatenaceae bacterium]